MNASAHPHQVFHHRQSLTQVRSRFARQAEDKVYDYLIAALPRQGHRFQNTLDIVGPVQASSIRGLPDCAPNTISSLSANSFSRSSVSGVTCSGLTSEGSVRR